MQVGLSSHIGYGFETTLQRYFEHVDSWGRKFPAGFSVFGNRACVPSVVGASGSAGELDPAPVAPGGRPSVAAGGRFSHLSQGGKAS